MAIKQKPAVKNELLLEDAIAMFKEDLGQTLRATLLYNDMIEMIVHEPKDERYKDVLILFTSNQMEELIALWQEWKELPDDNTSEN